MALRHFLALTFVCSVLADDKLRLDCLLNEKDITAAECTKRECHWQASPVAHVPHCYLDTSKVGYNLKEAATTRANGLDATLVINPQAHKSLPFTPIKQLKLEVNYLTENILRIRITDPAHKRYEVPIQSEFNIPNEHPSSTKYEVTLKDHFNLVVTRKATGAKIIDTSIGGLIYSDKFIQFASNVATENVYGVGENFHTSFKHDMNIYHTYPIFSRERVMREKERNNYGVHPFYTVAENDGKSHGVFLLNSNAMAYTMLPGPAVSVKTTGGILDLFVLLGDNPEHVVQMYTSIIGRPVMPPFWGLGFQLCRYGVNSLDYYKKVIDRNLEHDVPVDVQYLDIDYMAGRQNFQYDQTKFKGLPEYIKETKTKHNIRWTINISPVIEGDKKGYRAFDEGYKRDVFVKWSNSTPIAQRSNPANVPTDKNIFYGHMWPHGPVAFPDFLKNATVQYWVDMLKEFHKILEFDALWTDMNEPVDFPSEIHCPDDGLGFSMVSQNFPDSLNHYTICMGAVQGEHSEFRHYDVHSLYGLTETKATLKGVHEATGKRGFVVSRSTYVSSGKYVSHWFGDNFATWEHLRQSIVSLLEFSLFGITFTGADICGFNHNTTPELCRRWYQLGAFYPFSRTHNADDAKIDQDPAYWIEAGHPEVTKSAIAALRTRYQLIHYLYTLFYRSHVYGETLARPMHHEFPHDGAARTIDQQFFLGSSILVSPFVHEKQTTLKAHVPVGVQWFKLSGDFVEKLNANSSQVEFPDSFSDRPILLKSGSILPVVSEHNLPKPLNTVHLRQMPIELWILPTLNGSAHGDLFFDDGESIDSIGKGTYNYYEFKFDKCHLTISAKHSGYKGLLGGHDILRISSIHVAVPNLNHQTLQVTADGAHLNSTLVGHSLKIATNIDLLHSNASHTLSVMTTSNECIFN